MEVSRVGILKWGAFLLNYSYFIRVLSSPFRLLAAVADLCTEIPLESILFLSVLKAQRPYSWRPEYLEIVNVGYATHLQETGTRGHHYIIFLIRIPVDMQSKVGKPSSSPSIC